MGETSGKRATRHRALRYAFAIGLVGGTVGVGSALPQVLEQTPFLFFYPAVLAAAVFGGLGPGLVATLALSLCYALWLDPAPGRVLTGDLVDSVRAAVFVGAGVGVSLLARFQRLATERARQQAQEAREQAQYHRAVMANMGEGLYTLDGDGLVTYVNEAAERVLGWSCAELLGRRMHEMIHSRRPDGTPFPIEQCSGIKVLEKGGTLTDHPDVFIRKDGTFFPVVYSSAPLFGAGRIVGLVVVFRDVTAQRQAEAAQRESEERFAAFMRHLPGPAWMKDLQGRYLLANPQAEQIFDRTLQQIQGRTDEEIFPPDTARIFQENDRRAWTEGVVQATEVLRQSDGVYHHSIVSKFVIPGPDGDPARIGGVAFDITERIRAEEALRTSEQRLRATFDYAGVGIVEVENDDRFIAVNDRVCEMLGYRREELLGMTVDELTLREDRAESHSVNAELHQGARNRADYEKRYLRRDGSPLWVHVNISAVRDSEGRWLRSIATIDDISDRKATEQALRESELFYRQTLESIPGMVFTTRPDGFCDYQSQQWVDFTGVPMSDHLGDGWNALLHPDDRLPALAAWRSAAEGRAPYDLEYRVRRCDGEYEWFKVRGRPIRDTAGQVVRWFGAAVNIDDLKKTEEALHQSQARLQEANALLEQRVEEQTAEIRRRANQLHALALQLNRVESRERRRLAQILHDHLQQLLVGAKFNVSILQGKLSGEDLETARQVQGLLDESLGISRSLTAELSPPVLHNGTFAAALSWLAEQMHEKHGLQVQVQADAQVNPSGEELRFLLFQSVRELLFNVVKHAGVGRAVVRMDYDNGDQVRILVADDGQGFKPRSLGASSGGLGLFSIREHLEPLGGRLQIDSAPGKGTRIMVLAPVRLAVPRSAPQMQVKEPKTLVPARAEPATRTQGKIRVLLADDHAVVRDGLARLLETNADIQVVGQARDGQQAIDLALVLRPDVIVMDVSMPIMDGIEATRRIVTQRPGTCVIGLSMHEDVEVAAVMREAGAAAYLTKTAAPERLVAVVRECSVVGQPQ